MDNKGDTSEQAASGAEVLVAIVNFVLGCFITSEKNVKRRAIFLLPCTSKQLNDRLICQVSLFPPFNIANHLL